MQIPYQNHFLQAHLHPGQTGQILEHPTSQNLLKGRDPVLSVIIRRMVKLGKSTNFLSATVKKTAKEAKMKLNVPFSATPEYTSV